jgi:hypothetical protein
MTTEKDYIKVQVGYVPSIMYNNCTPNSFYQFNPATFLIVENSEGNICYLNQSLDKINGHSFSLNKIPYLSSITLKEVAPISKVNVTTTSFFKNKENLLIHFHWTDEWKIYDLNLNEVQINKECFINYIDSETFSNKYVYKNKFYFGNAPTYQEVSNLEWNGAKPNYVYFHSTPDYFLSPYNCEIDKIIRIELSSVVDSYRQTINGRSSSIHWDPLKIPSSYRIAKFTLECKPEYKTNFFGFLSDIIYKNDNEEYFLLNQKTFKFSQVPADYKLLSIYSVSTLYPLGAELTDFSYEKVILNSKAYVIIDNEGVYHSVIKSRRGLIEIPTDNNIINPASTFECIYSSPNSNLYLKYGEGTGCSYLFTDYDGPRKEVDIETLEVGNSLSEVPQGTRNVAKIYNSCFTLKGNKPQIESYTLYGIEGENSKYSVNMYAKNIQVQDLTSQKRVSLSGILSSYNLYIYKDKIIDVINSETGEYKELLSLFQEIEFSQNSEFGDLSSAEKILDIYSTFEYLY